MASKKPVASEYLPARTLIPELTDDDKGQDVWSTTPELDTELEIAGIEATLGITGQRIFRIKTPSAGTENAWKGLMYGVKFVEGIGFTNDQELAERIVREFPAYVLE